MFTSSTNKTIFLFGGAPNFVLRFFSSFDSIRSCVSSAGVCAEKLRTIGMRSFGSADRAK